MRFYMGKKLCSLFWDYKEWFKEEEILIVWDNIYIKDYNTNMATMEVWCLFSYESVVIIQ